MKTPPLLLGMTLLFWGWQAGFPVVGAVMAVVLESARFVKLRWDLRTRISAASGLFAWCWRWRRRVYGLCGKRRPGQL